MLRTRLALFALLLPAAAPAALFHLKGSSERSPAITLRKRIHVNTLITQPGTMDIEWGGAFSSDGSFTFPTAIHFTPEGPHAWWGRTEFSASFDSLSYNQVNHFGDRVSAAATCVVRDGDKLDIAIAHHASGGGADPVAEMIDLIIGERIEAGAELGAAPPYVMTLGREMDCRRKREAAV